MSLLSEQICKELKEVKMEANEIKDFSKIKKRRKRNNPLLFFNVY